MQYELIRQRHTSRRISIALADLGTRPVSKESPSFKWKEILEIHFLWNLGVSQGSTSFLLKISGSEMFCYFKNVWDHGFFVCKLSRFNDYHLVFSLQFFWRAQENLRIKTGRLKSVWQMLTKRLMMNFYWKHPRRKFVRRALDVQLNTLTYKGCCTS